MMLKVFGLNGEMQNVRVSKEFFQSTMVFVARKGREISYTPQMKAMDFGEDLFGKNFRGYVLYAGDKIYAKFDKNNRNASNKNRKKSNSSSQTGSSNQKSNQNKKGSSGATNRKRHQKNQKRNQHSSQEVTKKF